MFTRILVPIDGSEHAGRALAIASDLAATYGAQLMLLHVITSYDVPPALARFVEIEKIPEAKTTQHVEPLVVGPPHVVVPRPAGAKKHLDRHAEMHTVARTLLEEARSAAARQGVEVIKVATAEGNAATRILDFARAEKADAIVMGSRGLSDLKGAFVGSVSHKVCNEADCVCITVT